MHVMHAYRVIATAFEPDRKSKKEIEQQIDAFRNYNGGVEEVDILVKAAEAHLSFVKEDGGDVAQAEKILEALKVIRTDIISRN